jgi:diguanylate cyclase (GGDEF)-like protein
MRVLVADDEIGVLAAYRICLDQGAPQGIDETDLLSAALFGNDDAATATVDAPKWTHVDYVSQGEAAIAAVACAINEGQPYSVLFLDMRMPPGIDGKETARQVRALDQNINIVVVTGYSDHSPLEVARVAGPLDKLYYLAKPFETAEIRSLAGSLCAKWSMEGELRRAHDALALKNTELEASEARCRHIALHDHLTHLPNRLAFSLFLDEAKSTPDRDFAVMLIDLDRFKQVNDALGHSAGDALMCSLSERLHKLLPTDSLLARLGGDEFGIILKNAEPERVAKLTDAMLQCCAMPFEILGTQVRVGASIGIAARGSEIGIASSELLRRADLALYAAKAQGRNCARYFDPEYDASARQRADIDNKLRDALADGGLTLAYQPIIDPVDGSPVGYEALLRWHDAEMGQVSPTIFVPIAEETGLIVPLGEWVIEQAIAECANWDFGYVSINISTRHFQSPSLIEFICKQAARHGVPHDRIQLEITETALFDDPRQAATILVALRECGIRIALDDFGTGYSSLVNLKDFEIDCIKIDQSFVDALGHDRQTSAIVQAVTALARALGLKVVAEGVETDIQVQALRLVGCELMQGYFYSAAMPADELPYTKNEGVQPGQSNLVRAA